jgi:uncharacterized membrane protein
MSGQGKLMTGMLVGAGAMYIWPPATRLVLGGAGAVVAYRGARTRGARGQFLTLLGLGLIARAAGRAPARRLVQLATGPRGFTVERTVLVKAPAAQLWDLWSNFENFPRFMAHVREVTKLDEKRSHWVAVGPAGLPVEWDAVVSDWVPQQFIRWSSAEGSAVETSGQVRLRSISDYETGVDIQLSYRPLVGAAAQAMASMMGADPKQAMAEDLVRLKSLLEDRPASAPEASVPLPEVVSNKPARSKRRSRKKS